MSTQCSMKIREQPRSWRESCRPQDCFFTDWKMYGQKCYPGNRRGKGHAVDATGRPSPPASRGAGKRVAVHEVEPGCGRRFPPPGRVRRCCSTSFPAHMRNLETRDPVARHVAGSTRGPGVASRRARTSICRLDADAEEGAWRRPPRDRFARPRSRPGWRMQSGIAP